MFQQFSVLLKGVAAVVAMAVLSPVALAQPLQGNSTAGEALWNANGCSGCHTVAKSRADITARAPAGMTFSKALAALNAALAGTDLDGNATGMFSFAAVLNSTNRNDIAAYIAGLAGPAPIISYSPSGGAIFAATAVGANATTTVTIRNTGTAPLTFATNNAVTIASGGDAADFRVGSSNCPAMTLQPNTDSCTISVIFTPSAGTSLTRTASLGLTTTTSTSLVPLQGTVATTTTPSAPPPGSAANPPTGGGGGATTWIWAGWLALALLLRRLRIARTDASTRAFCVLRPAHLRRS